MAWCLDTCICIDLLRGKLPTAQKLLSNTSPQKIKLPAVVVAELLLGTRKSRDPEKTMESLDVLLSTFEHLPFDTAAAEHYAAIRAELESQGTVIGSNEMLIAAIARSRGDILVTNNVSEFARVPSLRIESWQEVSW